MRAETRHQLKEDRFRKETLHAAEATVHWSQEHRNKLVPAAIAVAVLVALIGGIWFYFDQQDQKASIELGQATRTLDTPIRPAGMPAQPDQPSFASSTERNTKAKQQFQAVIDKYPHTRSADFARYFVGVADVNLGDNAAGEASMKKVSDVHNSDLSSLATFALASIYRNENRSKDAVDIYKKLIDKPTNTVAKVTSQLALADTYESMNQPAEAKRIYQEIQKDNPKSQLAQLAAAKLEGLK